MSPVVLLVLVVRVCGVLLDDETKIMWHGWIENMMSEHRVRVGRASTDTVFEPQPRHIKAAILVHHACSWRCEKSLQLTPELHLLSLRVDIGGFIPEGDAHCVGGGSRKANASCLVADDFNVGSDRIA